MREVTQTYKIFHFNELSEPAREKAREGFRDAQQDFFDNHLSQEDALAMYYDTDYMLSDEYANEWMGEVMADEYEFLEDGTRYLA